MDVSNLLGLEFPTLEDSVSIEQLNNNFKKLENYVKETSYQFLQEIDVTMNGTIGKLDFYQEEYSEWQLVLEGELKDATIKLYIMSTSNTIFNCVDEYSRKATLTCLSSFVYTVLGLAVTSESYISIASYENGGMKGSYKLKLYGRKAPNYVSLSI